MPSHLFRPTSLGHRLGAGFAFVLALAMALAALAAHELTQAGKRLNAIVETQQQRANAGHRLLEHLNAAAIQARNITLMTDMPGIEAEMASMKASLKAYEVTQRDLQLTLEADPPDSAHRQQIAAIVALAARTLPDLLTAAEQGADGDSVSATLTLTQRVRANELELRGQLAGFKQLQVEAAAQAVRQADAARHRAFAVGAALVLGALLAGSAVAWWLTRSIQTGVERALGVAERIARGDLSEDVPKASADELGRLLQALDSMQARLRMLVGEIRGSAESIQMASGEVAAGNADLSQRTEEAAARLQQTASSTEQLTGTVQHSAQAAGEADRLSAGATEVARQGGAVVAEVVLTMEQIDSASRRIADITGVIDGIAFQTNILALNAAVEAARAGEQGRGFAVVAGEVRSLAQRSAEAAREIKSLIGGSVARVEAGTRLASDAGQTMREIVSSVERVAATIGEITRSAQTQSRDIGQVNDAIMELDRMTQQNSALVEQSAAAAASLSEQAERLTSVVGSFRLTR